MVSSVTAVADHRSHPSPGRYPQRGDHTSRAGAELVSDQQLGWFTDHIREGIAVTRHQPELLQPARSTVAATSCAVSASMAMLRREQHAADDLPGMPNP